MSTLRRARGGPRAAGGALLLLGGVLLLGGTPGDLQAQSWSTTQFERRAQGTDVNRLQVEATYGAGTFRLGPTEGNEFLYRARIRYDEEQFRPEHEFAGGTLRVGTRSREGEGRRLNVSRSADQAEFDLRLGSTVPAELNLTFGAVRAELELGGIPVSGLEIATGASETTLRVSRPNTATLETATFRVGAASFTARDLGRLGARNIDVEAGMGEVRLELGGLSRALTEVRVSMGLGSLEIQLPAEVGIEVLRSGFLASMNAPGLTREGSRWVSPNWDSAPVRVRVLLSAALGSVNIQRLP